VYVQAYRFLQPTATDYTLQIVTTAGVATGVQYVAANKRLITPYGALLKLGSQQAFSVLQPNSNRLHLTEPYGSWRIYISLQFFAA
jgi:hypothetical protein